MKYRPDIDGLRALAVLSVMLYHVHAAWLPGGFVGVDVFFVISGFVVSASLADSNQRGIGRFIAEFYARRLARIVPALVVMLVAAAIAATLFIPNAWLSTLNQRTALAAFLGLSNWVMQRNTDTYFSPRAEFNPYTHTWSLGVEEQFYLICPLLLFLWVRARVTGSPRREKLPVVVMALLGLGSLAGSAWSTTASPDAAFYSIFFRFWELAAGALLFQFTTAAASDAPRALRPTARYESWAGLGIIALVMVFGTAAHFPFPWAIVVVVGTLLLIGGVGAPTDDRLRRFFAKTVAVWIGKRSYSLYLWHWPIFVLMRWTVGLDSPLMYSIALGATFVLATASYRLVELPLRHNATLQRLQPVLRIALFLLLIVAARRSVQGVFNHASTISLSVVTRRPIDWYVEERMPRADTAQRRCTVAFESQSVSGGKVATYRPSACRGAADTRKMAVFGDSHAEAYLPMFDQLSAETGVVITVYSFESCAYLDLLSPMATGRPRGCVEFMRAASEATAASAHEGDLVFLPSLRQWRFGDQWAPSPDRNVDSLMLSESATKRIALAEREAIDWLRPLVSNGMVVVFEAPPPIFRSPPFRCSDAFNRNNPICRGGLTQPRAYLERLREPVVAAMGRIATALSSVRVWDPFPVLCPGETCSTTREGWPLFFDGDHVSAFANTVLYPSFRAFFGGL